MDSSFGGDSADDIINGSEDQAKLVQIIDNFIASLQSQKSAGSAGPPSSEELCSAGSSVKRGNMGGPNDDILIGTSVRETITGNAGNDRIYGCAGDDTFNGNVGSDSIVGSSGADKLLGNEGADFLKGDLGDDELQGNEGNDYLEGNIGNDDLYGNNGDDILVGGIGADKFFCGSGNNDRVVDFNAAEGDIQPSNDCELSGPVPATTSAQSAGTEASIQLLENPPAAPLQQQQNQLQWPAQPQHEVQLPTFFLVEKQPPITFQFWHCLYLTKVG